MSQRYEVCCCWKRALTVVGKGVIKEVEVQLYGLIRKFGPNGQSWASLTRLELAKDSIPTFDLFPWTVIHYTDVESSPFFGISEFKVEFCRFVFEIFGSIFPACLQDAVAKVESLMVFSKGFDVVCNAGIFAEHVYLMENLKLNRRLKDMISFNEVNDKGSIVRHQVVNYAAFHETVAAPSNAFQDHAAFGGASALMEVVSEDGK